MVLHNRDVAEIFEKIAGILEFKGANQFRIRAYQNAARTIGNLSRNVSDLIAEDKDLTQYSGIGKDLAQKIQEIVETGKLKFYDELQTSIPEELNRIMGIPGLGAKKVKAIYDQLHIDNIDDLKKAAHQKQIRDLKGFGPKTEQNIIEGIEEVKEGQKRIKLAIAEEYARPLMAYLKKDKNVKSIDLAGSYRRQAETIGDLDMLAVCKNREAMMKRFAAYEEVQRVVSQGKTRSTVILHSGLQVDLRVVSQKSFGSAMHYFTGSKAHNIAVRKIALKMNLKINEYGIFKGKKYIAGKTEKGIYRTLKMAYVEPELRENQGEIKAAQKGKLPKLITWDDMQGDLHTHTNATDGHDSLERMVEAAKKQGYQYIANTDHSRHLSVANGLDKKRLLKQIKQIDALNKKEKNFTILKGVELDILEDGTLDLPDNILKQLDIVAAAVHYKFTLSEKQQTERIIKAMDNPHVNIIAHPTGRLINQRKPYAVDMQRILKAAKDRGCVMELNAHPDRLDLNAIYCKAAREMGVKIAISTDSHSVDGLALMRYGIGQARRGWLEANDVINTHSVRSVKTLLKRA